MRVLLVLVVLVPAANPILPAQPWRLGMFPVVDRTGEIFGETYGHSVRRFLVEQLVRRGAEPIFLNTGPAFDYGDQQLARELADEAMVDAVVSIELVCVVGSSRWRRFEKAARMSGGDERAVAASILTRNVRRDDVRRLIESNAAVLVAQATLAPASDPSSVQVFFVSAPVRQKFLRELASIDLQTGAPSYGKFENTAAGRAAAGSAKKIAKRLLELLERRDYPATGAADYGATSCEVIFGVRYLDGGRTSRNYTVAVNGLEQTFAIRNGRVRVSVPSGHLQFRVTVQDAPYGMPVQKDYDANTFHSCAQASRNLFLEIGRIGEAMLRWEDS